jgi:uncharacterized protein YbbC (DUF1343 family)
MASVWLYPSLCLFEGTVVSVGRGTNEPFQQYGHPDLTDAITDFTPVDMPGIAMDPPYEGKTCHGYELKEFAEAFVKNSGSINLFWLTDAYQRLKTKTEFFTPYFDKLAGTDQLRLQIMEGKTEEQIRASWSDELKAYKLMRKKYILYPDFE